MTRLLLVAGGVVAPVAAVMIAAVLGFNEPGYSPLADHLSGLSSVEASSRWWMTAAFVLLGAGVAAIGAALRRMAAGGVAPVALIAAGVLATLVGVLPRTCVEVACTHPSTAHRLHDVISVPAYLSLIALPVVLAESAALGASRRIALAVAAATATTGAVFVVDAFEGLGGLLQRVAVLMPLTWLVVVAGRAGRLPVTGTSSAGE